MFSKYLQKEIELGAGCEIMGLPNPIKLEYYLLESEDGLQGQKAYGIEIVKRLDKTRIEAETIRNISCCKESTSRILDKLASNTVTPVSLPFVLDDIIGV